MKIVNVQQNSPEWHAHRGQYLNASDAPAMLGESKYKTRDQLLHEKATGITKEVDLGTQKLFDDGHKYEALARPIAEKIIGVELYPVTATAGKYSASFDGIDMTETVIFEHKSLNNELRKCFTDTGMIELPLMYRIQMEQQLMISGAEKCLFMASKWSDDETLIEENHFWYRPDLELRQRIVDGWALFEKDLATFTAPEVKEKVVAEVVEALPAPSIVAQGKLVASNLEAITPQFDTYLAETPRSGFKTDLDFANAEANSKNSRKMAKTLDDTCEAVIAQQSDINQAITVMRKYAKEFNALGLALEKAVTAEKELIKTNAILAAKNKYAAHVTTLQAEIVGMTLHRKLVCPDFAGAIKGVRTNESMHSRINDALNAGILDADALARDVRTKLAYLNEATKGYEGLFSDMPSFIFADLEYIKLMVDSRINAQKAIDTEREAQIKSKAEADAKEKVEAEQRAKEVAEAKAKFEAEQQNVNAQVADNQEAKEIKENIELKQSMPEQLNEPFNAIFMPAPSADELVTVIANHYKVDKQIAHKWLISTDFLILMAA
jgi:putative phage-type endonuclease